MTVNQTSDGGGRKRPERERPDTVNGGRRIGGRRIIHPRSTGCESCLTGRADIDGKNKDGRTALSLAMEHDQGRVQGIPQDFNFLNVPYRAVLESVEAEQPQTQSDPGMGG